MGSYNPRIDINVTENITLTTPGGQAVIALMGTAQWGEMNVVKTFTSFASLVSYYKADASGLTLVKGADLAYGNGAYIVKGVRVGHTGYAKATKDFAGNSGGISNVITVKGLYEGTYGNNILVTVLTKGSGRTVSITDGIVTENFTNNNATNGYATNSEIATAINGNSQLVSVTVLAGSETSNLIDAVSATALLSGNNGTASLAFSDYTTAFDNILNLEDFDILCIPEQTTDANHVTMAGKLETRANNEKKYAIYVTGVTSNEDIATQKARTSASQRLVLCSPSILYTPSYSDVQVTLDGSYLACAVAGKVASQDLEVAVTRKNVFVEDLIVSSSTLQKYYNAGELDELLGAGILPVSLIGGSVKVARGVTRVSDKTSIYYEIAIQRIVDYVKAQVQTKLDGFLGDPNLLRVRNAMASEVNGLLYQDKLDEIIVDYKPTEVVEGVSPDTVIVNMSIMPTFAINFISVSLSIDRL